MPDNASVIITGGCGFLGSHLVEKCLSNGHKVWAVDNFSTGTESNAKYLAQLKTAPTHFQLIRADVSENWSRFLPINIEKENLKYIFHFASPASPPHYQRLGLETMWANALGTREALTCADKVGARVIFASTSEIYGDPLIHPQPENYWGNVNTFGARSCYDESKRFAESLIFTHNKKFGTKHGFVRIFNTYGPRMNVEDGRVVINFLKQAMDGIALTVFGQGKQSRSFCYVDDLISGVLKYAESGETAPINLGNDKEFTILELAETVRALFPNKGLKLLHKELPEDDPKRRKPDLSLARSRLDWEPRTPLIEGLKLMLEWLKKQNP